jgi:two-component system chemotaxis response regulator CheY
MSKKILAVDDSVTMRKMVSVTLQRGGYEVIEAVDGVDALEKAQNETVDLVLIDINMPRMDGLTLIQELRKLEAYDQKPLLVLTTEASDEMKEKGRLAGANGWIVKPFSPEKLLQIVERVIGK